jgi:hypothetical protein
MNEDDDASSISQSFIDVIACAFGAVVLLVLILPVGEPDEVQLSPMPHDLNALEKELSVLDAQSAAAGEQRSALEREIRSLQETIATFRLDSNSHAAKLASLKGEVDTKSRLNDRLTTSLQDREAEAKRRVVPLNPTLENQYFGIPVDADYVLFIVDTSGSMQSIQNHVSKVIGNVLSVYPELSGIQVISDQGERLFNASTKLWLEDSTKMRALIASRLKDWVPYSNSSPAEGIQIAVNGYLRNGEKTALFVLGDDYVGNDFDIFLRRVEGIVSTKGIDESLLRIHAIGFENERQSLHPERFGILMRALTYRYNGVYLHITTSPDARIQIGRGERLLESE